MFVCWEMYQLPPRFPRARLVRRPAPSVLPPLLAAVAKSRSRFARFVPRPLPSCGRRPVGGSRWGSPLAMGVLYGCSRRLSMANFSVFLRSSSLHGPAVHPLCNLEAVQLFQQLLPMIAFCAPLRRPVGRAVRATHLYSALACTCARVRACARTRGYA